MAWRTLKGVFAFRFENHRPPNVFMYSLHRFFGRRLPFLFHLIPFQKYPSLIKNRRNRTTTETILFWSPCPRPQNSPAHFKNIYPFWLFTKNPFSHKRPSHYFWPFSEKNEATTNAFLRENFSFHPLAGALFRFSQFSCFLR